MQVSKLRPYSVKSAFKSRGRTRHKKCDEARPACSPCIRAGWSCDFVSSSPFEASQYGMTLPIRRLRYPSARPLLYGEHMHMEYFQVVCAGEFSLYFELPAWRNIILQATLAEPALHHAALAIGALTRSRYYPGIWHTPPAIAFSIRHYSMAIRDLRRRLDGSSQSLELAVLTSVVFSYIESLLELDSRTKMHIQAGYAILEDLRTRHDRTIAVSSQVGSNCQVGNVSTRYNLLASAMFQLTAQLNCLV
jgi:Fungal Zn(2)-Cys(6) binuclear cluster domain.